MGESPDHDERGEHTDKWPRLLGTTPRVRAIMRARIGIALVLCVVALGIAADWATSSPQVCASCHEMQAQVAAWEKSPHAEIGCFSCHLTPRPWYEWPQTVMERGAFLSRDLSKHTRGGYPDPIVMGEKDTKLIAEAVCKHCHNPSRVATPRFGILIRHAKHAKRNKSCTSCHFWTAHPKPTRTAASLMMDRCFTCHGLQKTAKAPGRCTLCHQKGLDLRPASHKNSGWRPDHGKVAKNHLQECTMCHGESACRDCHGLEMPHPAGWAEDKSGHAAVGTRNRALCEHCHEGKPYLCSMCHHPGFDAKKGPWVRQHFMMVRRTGASFCIRCHSGMYCVRCHSAGPARGGSREL